MPLFFWPLSLLVGVALCSTSFSHLFNDTVARSTLYYAASAYCVDWLSMGRWECRACDNDPGVKILLLARGVDNTYGFVAVNEKTEQIIIAFRGTQPSSLKNWWLNFNAEQTPYLDAGGLANIKVHKGWYEAWLSLQAQVQPVISMALRKFPSFKVVQTGHSLGAVFLLFNALDIALNQTALIANRRVLPAYTYGQPRVGSVQFAEWANNTLFEADMPWFRLVHGHDPVPHVPQRFLGGYHHIAEEVFYNQPMELWRRCDGSGEDPNCSDGLTTNANVEDHLYYFNLEVGDDCGPIFNEIKSFVK